MRGEDCATQWLGLGSSINMQMGFSKRWLDNSLPHLIAYIPRLLRQDEVGIKSSELEIRYNEATDVRIIKNTAGRDVESWTARALLAFSVIALVVGAEFTTILLVLIPSIICFVVAYYMPEKYIVLERSTGLITYPDWFFLPSHTIPFAEVEAIWQGVGGASGALAQRLVTAPPRPRSFPRAINLRMHSGRFERDWSFMVWYMDRNRPLPPGEAFDRYRDRDFQRRKAEGFPPPLYPSTFPTPEATDEQNRQRRKHWRDEDHYGRSESAWY